MKFRPCSRPSRTVNCLTCFRRPDWDSAHWTESINETSSTSSFSDIKFLTIVTPPNGMSLLPIKWSGTTSELLFLQSNDKQEGSRESGRGRAPPTRHVLPQLQQTKYSSRSSSSCFFEIARVSFTSQTRQVLIPLQAQLVLLPRQPSSAIF